MMRLMSPSAETNKQLRVWGTERHDLAHYRIAEVKVDTLTSSSGTFSPPASIPPSRPQARKSALHGITACQIQTYPCRRCRDGSRSSNEWELTRMGHLPICERERQSSCLSFNARTGVALTLASCF